MSAAVARAVAQELRDRGLRDARPAPPGEVGISGAERRMAGGIGAKKVDVTWATAESGLLLAVSVKTINARDNRTNNFQKNLTNRRGDLLFEALTLHKRFPFAVVVGLFFLDEGAADDATASRKSTFQNAHAAFRIFTNRESPAGRDEQFERLYIVLFGPEGDGTKLRFYLAGDTSEERDVDSVFDDMLLLLEERNPDFYEGKDGSLRKRG